MKNKISKIAAIQNENIQKCGYMIIEEAKQLTIKKFTNIIMPYKFVISTKVYDESNSLQKKKYIECL